MFLLTAALGLPAPITLRPSNATACECPATCASSLNAEACLYGCKAVDLPQDDRDTFCHAFSPSEPPSRPGVRGVLYKACMDAASACDVVNTAEAEVAAEAVEAATCAKDGECAPHWDLLRGPTGCCSNTGEYHHSLLCKSLFKCGPGRGTFGEVA